MRKQESANTHHNGMNEIEISLLDLVAPIWHSRWTVVIVTMLVAALGVAGSFYTAKYKSEGFFQFGGSPSTEVAEFPVVPGITLSDYKRFAAFYSDGEFQFGGSPGTEVAEFPVVPGITLSDYKRFAAFYSDGERFADYVKDKKMDSAPGIKELRRIFASRGSIAKLIEPVYPFTKLDAKNLMGQPKDNNDVIGLQIHAENSSPQTAQQMVGLLGRYTLDSIVYLVYVEKLRLKSSEISTKMMELDNEIIKSNEQLEEYARKVADLKQIVTRYPSAVNQQSQQVVSVTPESARYLSPVTQLVTTEVQSSEATEHIFKARREQQQMRLFQEYYTLAVALLNETKSGETLLRGLESVKDRVFKDKNLADEVVKEVYNKITIANQTAINVYLERCRFISGPTLPSRSTARPALVLAVGLVFGLLLSLILVFWRHWWRNNRDKIYG